MPCCDQSVEYLFSAARSLSPADAAYSSFVVQVWSICMVRGGVSVARHAVLPACHSPLILPSVSNHHEGAAGGVAGWTGLTKVIQVGAPMSVASSARCAGSRWQTPRPFALLLPGLASADPGARTSGHALRSPLVRGGDLMGGEGVVMRAASTPTTGLAPVRLASPADEVSCPLV